MRCFAVAQHDALGVLASLQLCVKKKVKRKRVLSVSRCPFSVPELVEGAG